MKRFTSVVVVFAALAAACGSSSGDAASSTASAEVTTTAPASGATETTTTSHGTTAPKLAFVRQGADDNTDIFVLDENGVETRLTDHEAFDEYPAVSPDGEMLVFDSFRTGDWETFLMNIDGSGLRQLTDAAGEDGYASWSPDSNAIVIDSERDGDVEIYVLQIEDGSVTQLTDNDAWDGEPEWSPDGEHIVFHSNRDGDDVFDLFLMKPDGTELERLTENGYRPAWSPDGSMIAFGKDPVEGGDRDLWVIDVETGSERLVAGGEPWDDDPVWSSDGTLIYFSSNRDGPFQIYSMKPDGSDVQLLVGGDADTFAPAVISAP